MLKKAIKPGPPQENPKQTNHQMKHISPRTGILYKPTTKPYRDSWSKRWPELNGTSKRTRISRNKSPDHQGQSKRSRLWKQRSPSSDRTSLNQNTRSQNTPPEADVGDDHQLNTRCQSRTCSSTTYRKNTNRTKAWGTKWRK